MSAVINDKSRSAAHRTQALAAARLAARCRLALACALALLAPVNGRQTPLELTLLGAYCIWAAAAMLASERASGWTSGRLPHRLDLLWFFAMVSATGGPASPLGWLFLAVVLRAALGWGLREG